MCGIVGKYKFKGNIESQDIKNMLNSITHRGPDYGDIWLKDNIGLGHRLLKIQDLSQKSFQPYKYGKYVMSYNGEIYNYQIIREQLEKENIFFESSGDTEVLIKCFEEYGVNRTLNMIEGCFAIALYDTVDDILYLIRDRVGIKPLHYYINNEGIIFASEIKAILQNKEVRKNYNLENIIISLACRLWMHPKWTMFNNIFNVEPGTYLKIEKDNVKEIKYYDLKYTNELNDEKIAIQEFGNEFEKTIKSKLISKVPIAAFLSGGIDSSLVCKIAQDKIKNSLNTYTICYEKDDDQDLIHAKELAEKENFKQHNILIKQEDYTIKNIDEVIYAVEEILIDKVYLPVYFNYREAKKDGFTVVLNGQGSDEVWLGYIFNWNIFNYTKETDNVEKLIESYYMPNMIFKGKFKKDFNENIKNTLKKYLKDTLEKYSKNENDDKLNDYSIMSIKTILHDLLLQEDKLAMAHSVESRVPFVDDHKLIELSMKMPSKLKIKDGREKYILRKFGEDKLPESIIKRRKYAFPEPPDIYDNKIKKICIENWNSISECKILNRIIDNKYWENIDNFSNRELWWLLVYWRFESVFKMEDI